MKIFIISTAIIIAYCALEFLHNLDAWDGKKWQTLWAWIRSIIIERLRPAPHVNVRLINGGVYYKKTPPWGKEAQSVHTIYNHLEHILSRDISLMRFELRSLFFNRENDVLLATAEFMARNGNKISVSHNIDTSIFQYIEGYPTVIIERAAYSILSQKIDFILEK